jgi:hypothetical protein
MPDAKKLTGNHDPSHGRPDPNPGGDKPMELKSPEPPPTGPKDLKARDGHLPRPSKDKPSKR